MDLAERMKIYEAVNKTTLPLNSFVIIRVDGRAFHTFTSQFEKPFSHVILNAMDNATIGLCKEVQNAVVGYVQSDEISILMYDGRNRHTQPWFKNEVEKIVSLSASNASGNFNRAMERYYFDKYNSVTDFFDKRPIAEFDSRVFVLPNIDEVVNYFLWRQQDAVRNSIQGLGQKYFSENKMKNKNTDMVQEMLFSEHGINWNDLSVRNKRGGMCVKTENGWKMVDVPHIVCDEENEFYSLIKNKTAKTI